VISPLQLTTPLTSVLDPLTPLTLASAGRGEPVHLFGVHVGGVDRVAAPVVWFLRRAPHSLLHKADLVWAEVLTRPEHDPPVRTIYSDDNLPVVRLSRLCAIVWSGALIESLVQPYVSLIYPADRPILRAEHVRLGLAFTEVYLRVQLSLALAFRWFVSVECAKSTSCLLEPMAQIPIAQALFEVACFKLRV
jgi:hypothetical protein